MRRLPILLTLCLLLPASAFARPGEATAPPPAPTSNAPATLTPPPLTAAPDDAAPPSAVAPSRPSALNTSVARGGATGAPYIVRILVETLLGTLGAGLAGGLLGYLNPYAGLVGVMAGAAITVSIVGLAFGQGAGVGNAVLGAVLGTALGSGLALIGGLLALTTLNNSGPPGSALLIVALVVAGLCPGLVSALLFESIPADPAKGRPTGSPAVTPRPARVAPAISLVPGGGVLGLTGWF